MNYAAEYVFPGHPDKLCDAIADALVEEAAKREMRALCGIEVSVHRASVFVTGRIACAGAEAIPVEEIVRACYRSAGYDEGWSPAPDQLEVRTNLCLGPLSDGESLLREVSDDQCIVTGYAVDSPGTPGLNFSQLTTLLRAHVVSGRVIGLDACIYDPDLDPGQRFAKPIVECLAAAVRA